MFGVTESQLKRLRIQFPEGTRVQLISMDDPHGVPEGTLGEVQFVDDAGQIHVKWENGSSLALIPGADRFQILN